MVVIVSKVEGLKSYHFFVVYLCVCFYGETSSWFFYMSLSINTRRDGEISKPFERRARWIHVGEIFLA